MHPYPPKHITLVSHECEYGLHHTCSLHRELEPVSVPQSPSLSQMTYCLSNGEGIVSLAPIKAVTYIASLLEKGMMDNISKIFNKFTFKLNFDAVKY